MNEIGIVEGIAKSSESTIPVNEGDYIDDEGLLCCGKCHTRKQTVIVLANGKQLKPRCVCKCEQERMKEEEEKRKEKELAEKVKELRKMGFPDAEMSRFTFENDDNANDYISGVAHRYVNNFVDMYKMHKGLLLYGTVGTGKTYIAACIANALIDRGYTCLVTNFARLTNTISSMRSDKQEYIDSLNGFSLIVIDDLSSERDTEYMNEIVMNIIDARYRSGKPLIATTNLTSEELNAPKDIRKKRVYSRLMEMCVPIEVKGTDRRRTKAVKEKSEVEKILGIKRR